MATPQPGNAPGRTAWMWWAIAVSLVVTYTVQAQSELMDFGASDPFNCVNVTTNCSIHAVNVSGGYIDQFGDPTCNCTCRVPWVGVRCEICPANYAASCTSCAPGFINFPNCTDDRCTNADCSDHSATVTGQRSTGCNCTCLNQYTGSTCETCPDNYDPNSFCGSCAAGYDFRSYPHCYEECDLTANCSDHASVVVGNVVQGCNCTCDAAWSGKSCDVCPSNYAGTGCNRCATGFSSYPACVPCSNALNCSNRGTAQYNSQTGSCICINCRNSWTGPGCGQCAERYDPTRDCGTCNTAAGFAGNYPDCDRLCTDARDCSGHASGVTGTYVTGCVCTCIPQWSGAQCEFCPEQYDATKNCQACAPDRIPPYPQCPLAPTTTPLSTSTTTTTTTTTMAATTTVLTVTPFNFSTTMGPGGESTTTPSGSFFPNASSTTPNPTQNDTTPTATPSDTPAPTNPPPTKSEERQPSKTPQPPPSHTKQPTRSHSISISYNESRSETISDNITVTPSISLTHCPNRTFDCLLFPGALPAEPTNCACQCRNQWSTALCLYCDPRYDEIWGDCGNCSAKHYFYPTCDYGVFLHGNFTPVWSDTGVIRDLLKANLLYALADDLTSFANNLTCNNATNVTGYMLKYDPENDLFNFDIDVLSAKASTVEIAAACICEALQTEFVAFFMNATSQLVDSLYPSRGVSLSLVNASCNILEESPCDGWCQNGNAPEDPLPAAPEDDPFPMWVIGLIIALLLIAVIAGLVYKRYKDVERIKLDRTGLRVRMINPDEMALFNQEMTKQDILPGGKVHPDSDRTGSRAVRRADAPVYIPKDDI